MMLLKRKHLAVHHFYLSDNKSIYKLKDVHGTQAETPTHIALKIIYEGTASHIEQAELNWCTVSIVYALRKSERTTRERGLNICVGTKRHLS